MQVERTYNLDSQVMPRTKVNGTAVITLDTDDIWLHKAPAKALHS